MRRTQHAFTLLEVLLACALLAVIGAAAFGWIASQGRASRAAQARLHALSAALSAVRLMNDDLALAVADGPEGRFRLVDDQTMTLTTLARQPGEEPGFHHVTWHYAPAMHLLQRILPGDAAQSVPVARVVSQQIASLRFSVSPLGGLSVQLRPNGDEHDEHDELTIPLWSEEH